MEYTPGVHVVHRMDLTYASVASILREFETEHGMSTEQFVSEYRAGKWARTHTAARWVGYASILDELTPPDGLPLIRSTGTRLVPA